MKKRLKIYLKKTRIPRTQKTQQKAKDFYPLKTKILNKAISKFYQQNISIYLKLIKAKKIKVKIKVNKYKNNKNEREK